jgi:hypothetical protein
VADDVRGPRELKLAAQAHLDEAIADGNPDEAYHWAAVMDAFRWADEDEPSVRVCDMPTVTQLRKLADAIRELERLRSSGWRLVQRPHEHDVSSRAIPELPQTSPSLDRLAERVEIRTMAPLDSAQRRALHHWVDLAVAGARNEDDALDLEHRLRHLIDET